MLIIRMVGELLQIDVEDNGVGFSSKQLEENKKRVSHALEITKERVAFLNKKQHQKILFDIKPGASKGTIVSFSIPFLAKY